MHLERGRDWTRKIFCAGSTRKYNEFLLSRNAPPWLKLSFGPVVNGDAADIVVDDDSSSCAPAVTTSTKERPPVAAGVVSGSAAQPSIAPVHDDDAVVVTQSFVASATDLLDYHHGNDNDNNRVAFMAADVLFTGGASGSIPNDAVPVFSCFNFLGPSTSSSGLSHLHQQSSLTRCQSNASTTSSSGTGGGDDDVAPGNIAAPNVANRGGNDNNDSNALPDPPYPRATNEATKHHSLAELARRGITTIQGEARCRRGNVPKAQWMNPVVPNCDDCGHEKCVCPVIAAEKERINWLFLLLRETLGLCTLDQLNYLCAHTNRHLIGTKDRVLFSTYEELCNQLVPGLITGHDQEASLPSPPPPPVHGAGSSSSGQKRKAAMDDHNVPPWLKLYLGPVVYGDAADIVIDDDSSSCAPAVTTIDRGAAAGGCRCAAQPSIAPVHDDDAVVVTPSFVASATDLLDYHRGNDNDGVAFMAAGVLFTGGASGSIPNDAVPVFSCFNFLGPSMSSSGLSHLHQQSSLTRRQSNASTTSSSGAGGGDDDVALGNIAALNVANSGGNDNNDGNALPDPPYPWATKKAAKHHPSPSSLAVASPPSKARLGAGAATHPRCPTTSAKITNICMTARRRWWMNPAVPNCDDCGHEKCVRPVIAAEKERINRLFLLLRETLGLCTLDQLTYFCAHTNRHRTGAKDRVLFSTYEELCKQLVPGIFTGHDQLRMH
uniref:DUF7086 domain-containing protein n=1 Tax=Oryza punctata TaxID=4537 RepID=A0A0E0MKY4_ORYPU